ncbi:MAG: YceI family protein [Thiobacillus sp.]|nr:YceI family protein [Thiobacillus sp.]
MKRLAMLATIVVFSSPAQAAPETYLIDNSQTTSQFSMKYLGIVSQTHSFDKVSGKVVIDPISKTGSAEVNIDASSVNTGNSALNNQLQTASFFDTVNHPAIVFKSSQIKLDDAQTSMAGELTIKGVTKAVTLAINGFKCSQDQTFNVESCGAQATVTVKRSDFNMGKLGFIASNEITLHMAIKAVKAQTYQQIASRDPAK